MFLSNQLTRCDVNVAWKLDVTWIWGATVHDDCAFSRRQCCLGSCFSSSSSFRALMSNEPGCSYPWLHLIPFHLPERSRFFFPLKMLMTKVESWGQRQRCCFGGCDSSWEEKQIRSCSGRRTPAAFRPEIPSFFFLFTPVWFLSIWSILSFKLSTMSGPSSDQLHRSTLSIYGVSFCRLLVFCLWCRHSVRWTIITWEEWLGPGLVSSVLTCFFTCRI